MLHLLDIKLLHIFLVYILLLGIQGFLGRGQPLKIPNFCQSVWKTARLWRILGLLGSRDPPLNSCYLFSYSIQFGNELERLTYSEIGDANFEVCIVNIQAVISLVRKWAHCRISSALVFSVDILNVFLDMFLISIFFLSDEKWSWDSQKVCSTPTLI